MKIKTSELTGPALDWAVDLALGGYNPGTLYSSYWAVGGPIIDRELIQTYPLRKNRKEFEWAAATLPWGDPATAKQAFGPTLLIAAMRCFVASKLGDEVDVPEELL